MIKATAENREVEQPKGFYLAGELPGGGAAASDQTCHEVTGSEVALT